MIYFDIDGVLSDSDGYLKTCDPRALDDTHLLFKTICKYYKTAFLEPKPLVDLSFLETVGDFTLLTALPNRDNIDSFTEDTDTIMQVLTNNKRKWVQKHIGECKLEIVNNARDKVKFCQPGDILVDDNKKTGANWQAKGGTWFPSIAAFLSGESKVSKNVPVADSQFIKEVLW